MAFLTKKLDETDFMVSSIARTCSKPPLVEFLEVSATPKIGPTVCSSLLFRPLTFPISVESETSPGSPRPHHNMQRPRRANIPSTRRKDDCAARRMRFHGFRRVIRPPARSTMATCLTTTLAVASSDSGGIKLCMSRFLLILHVVLLAMDPTGENDEIELPRLK